MRGWRVTYNSDKEADIGFGEAVTDKVVLALEHLLDAVERLEERDNGRFVRFLRRCKPGLVHTIYK